MKPRPPRPSPTTPLAKAAGRAQEFADTYEMPLLDHLRELRKRVIVCMWAVLVCVGASFAFAGPIFDWLSQPMNDALHVTGKGTMAITEATEGIVVQMKVAGIAGLFASSPVIAYQIWKFVAPGLYDKERRSVMPLVTASTFLFITGGAFAYYGVFRFGFPIFLSMNGDNVTAVLSINSYLTFAITLLVAFGVSFQLPIVVYFLARLGLINHRDMISGFRYGIVGIFIIAAVLTPPDVMSQMMMAGPLVVLYGVGIIVAWLFSTKPVPGKEKAAEG